jgi:hypothetical protein
VIDPLTKSVVPGTSANTLGDALTFGGGAELARAYGQLAGVAMPSWVVVDDEAWARINRAGLSVNLPRPVDVFNGTDLISFPAGQVVVQPVDAGTLFAGIHGLSPSARLAILGEAAASLQRDLVSGGTGTGLTSDLSTRRRLKWLSSLATRSLPQTTTP